MTAIRLRRILRAMRGADRRALARHYATQYPAASGTAREASSSSSSGEDVRTSGGAAFEQAAVAAPAIPAARPRPTLAVDLRAVPSAMEQRAAGWDA